MTGTQDPYCKSSNLRKKSEKPETIYLGNNDFEQACKPPYFPPKPHPIENEEAKIKHLNTVTKLLTGFIDELIVPLEKEEDLK